jgi:hypothetical protein
MPPGTSAGWMLRLTDLLGARPDEAQEEHLQRLVDGGVREDADLDFKQDHYGNSNQDRRKLAGDIAAMANDRGGLIIVGLREESDAAVELTPVELVDGEEGRIRQIAAGNIAPHVNLDVYVVAAADDPTRGYYLLIVPSSTLRPHAVRYDRNLRYPRRDGSTTRWLGEAEVADAYRDRFALATSQADRIDQVMGDGLRAMDLTDAAFVTVAVVPTSAGSMPIDLARVSAVEQWARALGPPNWFDGFFHGETPPAAAVGAHRVALSTSHGRDRPPSWQYAELYDDGSGFACRRLSDPRRTMSGDHPGVWILNEELLWELGRCLHLLGRHAAGNCGAWGDGLLEARVVGQDMRLAYQHWMSGFGFPEAVQGGQVLQGASSRHTVLVEAIAAVSQALSAATRLVATDVFHAFGSPEVRQITADGALRAGYLGGSSDLQAWAEQHGIQLSDEPVAGE